MQFTTSSGIRGTKASDHLDMIRGIAAIAVLYSHARVVLIESVRGRPSASSRLFYLLSGYGHSAVIIFFVLSGYLVGGTVIRSVGSNCWKWSHYLLARGVRLYVVLIPALLLTLAWDHVTLAKVGVETVPSDTGRAIVTVSTIEAGRSPMILIGNLLFLQTILVPSYGSNLALWSLANEFWYYIVFPLGMLACSGLRSSVSRTLHLVGASLLLWFIGFKIAVLFPVWLLGVALTVAPPIRVLGSKPAIILVTLVLLLILFFIGIRRIPESILANYLVGLSFAVFLAAMLQDRSPSQMGLYSKVAAKLASFSYTLYLVHLPLLVCFRAFFTQHSPWPADLKHWLLVCFVCILCVIYAIAISLLTEARTGAVRDYVTARIDSIRIMRNRSSFEP